MAYADYAYYKGAYQGRMGEADFARLSRQASAYLDAVTLRRIQGPWAADGRVRDACCAVADAYLQNEQGGEVLSASNDGYAETYAASGKTPEQRLYSAAALYLGWTGLLYRGVD